MSNANEELTIRFVLKPNGTSQEHIEMLADRCRDLIQDGFDMLMRHGVEVEEASLTVLNKTQEKERVTPQQLGYAN